MSTILDLYRSEISEQISKPIPFFFFAFSIFNIKYFKLVRVRFVGSSQLVDTMRKNWQRNSRHLDHSFIVKVLDHLF